MNNDRELLELAADAAGHDLLALTEYDDGSSWYATIASGDGDAEDFDPLNDDGDALRLAVKLGLQVLPYPIFEEPKHSVIVQKRYWDSDAERGREQAATLEVYDGDPAAATRRAIVRAAAELGRAS
jgi:hypothetical protein